MHSVMGVPLDVASWCSARPEQPHVVGLACVHQPRAHWTGGPGFSRYRRGAGEAGLGELLGQPEPWAVKVSLVPGAAGLTTAACSR